VAFLVAHFALVCVTVRRLMRDRDAIAQDLFTGTPWWKTYPLLAALLFVLGPAAIAQDTWEGTLHELGVGTDKAAPGGPGDPTVNAIGQIITHTCTEPRADCGMGAPREKARAILNLLRESGWTEPGDEKAAPSGTVVVDVTSDPAALQRIVASVLTPLDVKDILTLVRSVVDKPTDPESAATAHQLATVTLPALIGRLQAVTRAAETTEVAR
ncbi:MAG TPA: hypothetical protein VFP72_23175, partial [Kineosporiaceae bacterium]|nr:hypothetical protein [Kineosporiaceae bacterium]